MQVVDKQGLMPTVSNGAVENRSIISFVGLSSETKPTDAHEGIAIASGSTFFEMDTSTAYMYDAGGQRWYAL